MNILLSSLKVKGQLGVRFSRWSNGLKFYRNDSDNILNQSNTPSVSFEVKGQLGSDSQNALIGLKFE